jgi:uncharacterized membrane protein YhaH (DUF805 family)
MKLKILTIVVYVCAASALSYSLMRVLREGGYYAFESPELEWRALACFASPFLFVLAAFAVSRFPRRSHVMGAAAGMLTMPWLVSQEFAWFQIGNSWIALNTSGPHERTYRLLAELRILAVTAVVIAMVVSLLRLLPARWTLRKRPLRDRTWPAFAVCFLVLSVWFGCAVVPYRLPGEVQHQFDPDLRILHVEKRGLQFHETEISTFRNSFYVSQDDRRLFQYAFEIRSFRGELPANTLERVTSLLQLPQLSGIRTQPPKALRAWNAEGWYFFDPRRRLLSFTSEYGTTPPQEVVALFHEIEALHPTEDWGRESINDVCLGFCYDPLAGLGFLYAADRCRMDNDWWARCR